MLITNNKSFSFVSIANHFSRFMFAQDMRKVHAYLQAAIKL